MRTHWWIVEGETWRVLRSSGKLVDAFEVDVEGEESQAAAIWRCLKTHGHQNEGVLLGLGAWRGVSAVIEPELEEVRRDPQALALVLEHELPWAAEEFVADFVPNGRQFVGVAVQWAGVRELVQGLEDVGVWVQSISPWSLVRMQGLVREGVNGDQNVVLAEEGEAVSLMALRGGRLVGWEWLPTRDAETLRTRMGLMQVREVAAVTEGTGQRARPTDKEWVYVGLDEATQAALRDAVGEATVVSESVEIGASQVRRILSGKERPWVEWRRGALTDPRPYRAVRGLSLLTAGMGLVAIGLLIAAIQVRAGRYEAQAMELQAEQTRLFQELMPHQKIPIGVRIRLESELVKLKAERGNPEAVSQLVSTPAILEHAVAALPESIRLRVKILEVQGSQITLDCETLSLSDSATLVEALTREGFEVTAPRTELVGGLVPLQLIAIWKGTPVADGSVSKAASSGGTP